MAYFLATKAKPLAALADGFAVLSRRRTQYKISKIKLAISEMAITPARESTKACVASW
jgi:hypothetical protein